MSVAIRLIVGLGNPGCEFENTRHNAGFWLLNQIAQGCHVHLKLEKKFSGWLGHTGNGTEKIVLLKPNTYMNKSGLSVGAVANFYKFSAAQILVLHDELDLMPGEVKLKQGGSHAGHNGVRDIQAVLGDASFWRMRIGIGHPRKLDLVQAVSDFVLHPPACDEQMSIEKVLKKCRAAVPAMLQADYIQAARQLRSLPN